MIRSVRKINFKEFLSNKKWLIFVITFFVFTTSYVGAISFNKDPEVGVILPNNDYEPAWYIDPTTKNKLVLNQPIDAFRIMKKFGLGIKHKQLQKYLTNGFPKDLAGKILIDVDNKGEAYYISAEDLTGHFLSKPHFALIILKENGFKPNKKLDNIKLNNPLAQARQENLINLDNDLSIKDSDKISRPDDTKNLIINIEPIVSTGSFSKIITVSGSLINEHNLNIAEQGIIWGFEPEVNFTNYVGKVLDLSKSPNFSLVINDIIQNKTYYFKTYALVGDRVFYSNEEKFISLPRIFSGSSPAIVNLPSVATNSLTISGVNTLSLVGQVINNRGGNITAQGFCWSTTSDPTLENDCINVGFGQNEFTSAITVSDPDAIYYVRAYTTNSKGTSYGNQLITCGSLTVADADGYNYNIVKIGSQCWLKENLRVGIYVVADDKAPCQEYMRPSDPTHYWSCQTNDNQIEKYCYDNDQANCLTDGGLYEWQEAMALPASCVSADCSNLINSPHQGICPSGWHIPTDEEFAILEQRVVAKITSVNPQYPCSTRMDYDRWWVRRCADDNNTDSGGDYGAGKSLKAVGQGDGDDLVSFTTKLVGYRVWGSLAGMLFRLREFYADFWSANQAVGYDDTYLAWVRGIKHNVKTVERDGGIKSYGFSVRCVKD